MGLFRLLALGLIAWLVYRSLKSWRIAIIRRQDIPGELHRPPAPERFEPMARCARCGVHLPPNALSPAGRCGACERA